MNDAFPQIVIASDHAGFALKVKLVEQLNIRGINTHEMPHIDLGTFDETSVDYPDFAHLACALIAERQPTYRGILICGSGVGMSIVANRYEGIRCALVERVEAVILARQHNNVNVIALGARCITPATAIAILHAFLNTAFEGGRHATRIAKIDRSAQEAA